MEFEEFSRQFRERTAQRMLDFEAALARAQNRMERATQAEQARGRQHSPVVGQQNPAIHRGPRRSGPGHGEVRGILKRG